MLACAVSLHAVSRLYKLSPFLSAEEKSTREAKEKLERVERPKVARYVAVQTRLDEIKAARDGLKEQLDAAEAKLQEVRVRAG